jgi:hypothetical protein
MSYTRGDTYIWPSGDRVHLWVADGDDGWAESVWNEGRPHPRASGVGVPQEVMDEFVVMRFAQLLRARQVGSAVDRALAKHAGNGGCVALEQIAETLKAIPPPPPGEGRGEGT